MRDTTEYQQGRKAVDTGAVWEARVGDRGKERRR